MENTYFHITDYDTGEEFKLVRGLTLNECIDYSMVVYGNKPMVAIAILDDRFRTIHIL